jgi:2-iminobutanoate/2-iminopropanoate deaminase
MAYKTIQTDKAPAAIGPYSQGILSGNYLFVSGQIGLDPATGEIRNSDFSVEAGQALQNLCEILYQADMDIGNIVSVDVFLTDISNFAAFNELYSSFMGNARPARAVIEVSALPKGASVEVKCIACN